MDPLERRLLEAVTLDAPWELVEAFSRTPRWLPDQVNAGGAMIAQRLRALGIPVTVHHPEIYLAVPLAASVEAGGVTHRAKPPTSSLPVPEGRTAPLIHLAANPKALRSYSRDIVELFGGALRDEADARARIAGKILLTEGFGNPAIASLVEEWGGVGVIAANPGVDVHWGTCTTIWGTPDLDDLPRKPKIPMATVNKAAGEALRAVAGAGGSATIRSELLEGLFAQAIPVVEIPAADGNPDFVLLHGHYDSWDVGVGDNATGNATLLEIARVLWAHRAHLKRGVRIAWWAGHSTGRYAGSTWYADAFAMELDAHCVAQINCDSPGCRWASSFHDTTTMSETLALVQRAVHAVAPDAPFATKRPKQAGDYSFSNIGLTGFYMLSSTMPEALKAEKGYYDVSGCGGNIAWHTENDTLEIADRDFLLRDIHIYLLSTLRVTQPALLPFDFTATAEELRGHIARYASAAAGVFDLAPALAAIDAFAVAVSAFHQGATTGAIPAARANQVMKELARILVPLNYTKGPRFTHDPAVTAPPVPCLAVASEIARHSGLMLGFAKTQLMRGQNRAVAALQAATRLVA